jgi:predicted Zn-dependent protease
MYELPNSRDVELEADAIGIRLLSRAGYRPEAMLEYVRLQ